MIDKIRKLMMIAFVLTLIDHAIDLKSDLDANRMHVLYGKVYNETFYDIPRSYGHSYEIVVPGRVEGNAPPKFYKI